MLNRTSVCRRTVSVSPQAVSLWYYGLCGATVPLRTSRALLRRRSHALEHLTDSNTHHTIMYCSAIGRACVLRGQHQRLGACWLCTCELQCAQPCCPAAAVAVTRRQLHNEPSSGVEISEPGNVLRATVARFLSEKQASGDSHRRSLAQCSQRPRTDNTVGKCFSILR